MAEYPLSAPPPVQAPPSNLPEFTVSELAGAIKRTLEGRFDRVRVRGEISSFKKPNGMKNRDGPSCSISGGSQP